MSRALGGLDPDWAGRGPAWRRALSPLIRFEAAALAVLNPADPRPDTFLLLDGVARGRLGAWFGGEWREDCLLHDAAAGQPLCRMDHAGLLHGQAVAITWPTCPSRGLCWWLALARQDEPFSELEQQVANLLLRTLAARFEFPREPELGRILLDGRFDALHVDSVTCLRLMRKPQLAEELKAMLPPIIAQRWRRLADHEPHSVFVAFDGQPTWVRFWRARAAHAESRCWYLELRPLDADDPPHVGLVDDPRVAEAMGYLTDHYDQSPSLAEVARQVRTSPFHFHRLFTRQTGVSPKHFLLRTQLMHAKQLLRATRMPIGTIARSTGFSSHGHFTATFNRIVGRNPSDYREQF